ncbi:enoyl-CoA hydratase-related protein [Methylobacterium sp. J-026]|uniref:enoyl-CoA hydratase-related protein n=1 Tax=Methylobacterium sp. J-026 TaxID=2836624 RepID=UPI001FBBDFDF|nr:enoyl-CoA hydratase-related protein [Methylobacterium sp. J-026]
MTQRFFVELTDAGHEVAVEIYAGDEGRLEGAFASFRPDLTIAPFLTRAIPERLWRAYLTLIVHPGVEGDRGPSALDWAIQERWDRWGVTLLQAEAEMDAGPIWATRTFPLRQAPKSSVYRREVIDGAVACLWEAMANVQTSGFAPRPLDYSAPTALGRLRPSMKQADRRIDWSRHATAEVLARIHAADGVPGVLDEVFGRAVYLHAACAEPRLRGEPGQVIARSESGALCRATVDGAVWIGRLKPKQEGGGIKRAAVQVLGDALPADLPVAAVSEELPYPNPVEEVRSERDGDVLRLRFDFHNGAMSTAQCRSLQAAFRQAREHAPKVIVLAGGDDLWSNGIHLNEIEASADAAAESWANIVAMDDLIREIILATDTVVVAAVGRNVGAGGAILPLAADFVLAREGVVLNPHYRNMGWLYGSEYWTYLLPRRVGWERAVTLTEACLPISARRAAQIGLADEALAGDAAAFDRAVQAFAAARAGEHAAITGRKQAARAADEVQRPLAHYRRAELTQMYRNFYQPDSPYHRARSAFVYKRPACWSPASVAMLAGTAANETGASPLPAPGGVCLATAAE